MEPPFLRLLIQEKLADGRLPRDHVPSLSSRQGNGETCDGCEGLVTSAQMLMEVLDARGGEVRVHLVCYYLWVVERQAYGPEPSVRPPARFAFRAPGARSGRRRAPSAPPVRPTRLTSP